MQLRYLTGNQFKIDSARLAMEPYGIEIIPVSLDIPEIQADTNEEIVRASVLSGVKLLNVPLMREDHGFYLDAFPGFPGPYMAHIEKTIPPDAVLSLLKDKPRTGYFSLALAYATPDGELIEMSYQLPCTVATEMRSGNKDFGWDSIICLKNSDRAICEYPATERYEFFIDNYVRLAQQLTNKPSAAFL
jgi:XTP/dITP diphosphohydrolase